LELGLEGIVAVGRSFYDRPGPVAYLTGHFPPFPTAPADGGLYGLGYAFLVMAVGSDPVLIVDGRSFRADLVPMADVRQAADLLAELASVLREKGLARARVGLAGEDLFPLGFFRRLSAELPDLVLVGFDDILDAFRWRKDPIEIELLRQASHVACQGLAAALEACKEGTTEAQVAAAGIAAAMEAGADFVRYLRVHSGPWSAWGSRWPQATDRPLGRGDIVTLDIIGAFQGYGFDVLRTTCVGQPDERQRLLLEAIDASTEAALKAIAPGVSVQEVYAALRGPIENAGFAQFLSSFFGHSIGIETVERPVLTASSTACLEEGMVLCIEPGVYIPGWGGASIEQEVVVTAHGCELLTKCPTRLWQ
jgi:Xaa-Pro aminopeptidase